MEYFCWDCEIILHEKEITFCWSCREHRSDKHPPKYNNMGYACHGAGPDGRWTDRLKQRTRSVLWEETIAYLRPDTEVAEE